MPPEKERINVMFGRRLVILRGLAGLDQEQVAAVVEAHRDRVSRWERCVAMPKVWELEKLAEFFKVSTDSLLGRTKFEEGTIPQPPKRPRKLPRRDRRPPLSGGTGTGD